MAEHVSKDTQFFVDKLGTGVTFVQVTQVRSIQHGDRSVPVVEFSDLDATTLRRRPGLPDPGTITLELNYDPADVEHKHLEDQVDAPEVLNFRVRFGQNSPAQLRTFPGFVTGFDSGGGENQDALPATVTIQLSGKPVPSVETGD
ncbi:phage tail tube protein [Paludisphaera sp.]|uniref:phage tail tube protein n=1 Tax=Paludisphaera sp. TaxID=2017432 RepID=UPI00301DAFD3